MSGYTPPGPPGPPYYGYYPPQPPHYPPQPPHYPPLYPPAPQYPPHVPPGSFTYLPPVYQYQPQPQWQPPTPQPYVDPPIIVDPPIVVEQPTVVEAAGPLVTFSEDVVSWVPATPTTAQDLEHKAVVGGKEGYDGSPLWVIRAHHKGELMPGKLAIKHRYAFIPKAGMEVPVHNFEVLYSKPGALQWVSAKDGKVPAGAIVAGNTLNAESLYVGRVPHKRSVTPGKVNPSQGCCFISYGGKEISYRKYEVLCQIF